MQAVRDAAWQLVAQGKLIVTQVRSARFGTPLARHWHCYCPVFALSPDAPLDSPLTMFWQGGREVAPGAAGAIRLRILRRE